MLLHLIYLLLRKKTAKCT